MQIKWHGHACFEIRTGIRVVIDPHDGRSIGLKTPKLRADYVLITHDHFDHNATRVVEGAFKVIKGPGLYTLPGGIKIKGIEAYHDTVQGAKRGKITMYRIDSESMHMLHTGDLGHTLSKNIIDEIGSVDVLFVPVGGTYTLDAKQAYEVVRELNPKVVVPMHYKIPGLTLGLAPVEEFLKMFPSESISFVGNSVEFFREDLPDSTEIWVFNL